MAAENTPAERPIPIPKPDRPVMPDGYGVPESDEGMLPWSFVDERLSRARNYWIATVRPDGRPHATPVWGIWMDGRIYFDGSPETRRGRNMAANPQVVVHLEDGTEVVILEGEAREIKNQDRSFGERLAQAYASKYADQNYQPEPDTWDQGGLYTVEPRVVLAWHKFPQDVTRWVFGRSGAGG